MRLPDIVNKKLKEHVGGKEFFDSLDASVRCHTWCEKLYNLYVGTHNVRHHTVIVSGDFGITFGNWYIYRNNAQILCIKTPVFVSGGLRKSSKIDDLSFMPGVIKDNTFIFFDDSLYSGNTRDVIKAHLEELGGVLTHTFVIYDGSKTKDPDVTSLYRYYS